MARAETIAAFFRKDHDEIEALLAAVDFVDPIQVFPRAAEFARRLRRHIAWEERLTAVLGPHDLKEERVLYPACDRELSREAVRRLLSEIRK